jgi:glycosyltransferase involved in cell wall biosynthesis
MILALQTTTFSAFGGIPTYNRLVCRVLNESVAKGSAQILIATDTGDDLLRPAAELPMLKMRAFDNRRARFVRSVFQLAVMQRIDLVLIGHVNYAPLGLLIKRIQPRARVGVLLYGIEAWQPLSSLKRRGLRDADFFIAISNYTKRRAADANKLVGERIHVLPNALEWGNSTTPGPVAPGIKLLSVCRLDRHEQYKGVDHVIEVLPKLAEHVPNIQYVVVGEGSDLDRHKRLAEQHGVGDRVTFLGSVDHETLCQCYQQCDVFVMPSGGEGFGFVFLEAMKYGKPIVAANNGGAPEVVQNESTGKLVQYGNRDQLAQALLELCGNRELRLRLGSAGRDVLVRQFTYTHFRKRLARILSVEMPGKFAEPENWEGVNVEGA